MRDLEDGMKKLILIAVLLATPACCTERNAVTGVSVDSYVEALTKVRSNIAEIRSDVILVDYDADIKTANIQLIDATIQLCDDTLAGKNAAPAEGGQ